MPNLRLVFLSTLIFLYFPSQTQALTPTPSPNPNLTNLTFKLKLQGVTNPVPDLPPPYVQLTLSQQGITKYLFPQVDTYNQNTPDHTYISSPTSRIINLGIYSVLVKMPGRLQRTFSVNLSTPASAAQIFDFTTKPLLAGDFVTTDSTGLLDPSEENHLKINDLTAQLSQFTSLSSPTSFVYDLNQDGYLKIDDLAITLTNYITLDNSGE